MLKVKISRISEIRRISKSTILTSKGRMFSAKIFQFVVKQRPLYNVANDHIYVTYSEDVKNGLDPSKNDFQGFSGY